ncbi:MAG TPA: enoyl-CoA hydratase-related protein [Acidimicrobiales bacterium]|nr:enoyl-CoA hydratase-related protein [Acidimicrobiales bacterium]
MSHEFSTIGFERDGDVLVVTVDHPSSPINAVDGALHEDLAALFPRLQAERDARAVLLTGRGSAFSAGGDFDWFPTLQDPTALEHLRLDARAMIWDLLDVHLPIVAAVNGHAMGLGASVALLSDVVFVAEGATIGDPHVKVGLVAGDGGTIAWPLALGPMLAKRFLLTGDPVTADEAVRLGLAHRAVPADDLHAEALAFAHRLAAGAPLAVQYTKQAVNAWIKATAGPSFDLAQALEIATFRSEDHREALTAVRERRPPRFRGR